MLVHQHFDQVHIRLVSQFINGISRVIQKLLRHFNVIIISVSFMASFSVLPCYYFFKFEGNTITVICRELKNIVSTA